MSKTTEFIIIWFTVLLLAVIGTFHNKLSKQNQTRFIVFLSFVFAFLYSHRTLGADLLNYKNYYEYVVNGVFSSKTLYEQYFEMTFEPLYILWMHISRILGFTYETSNFFMVLLPELLVVNLLYRKTKYPLMGYTLYIVLFMFQFDVVRFTIAASIIPYAFYSDHKIKKIVLYLIAILFHYTAILFVVYELLSKSKLLSKNYLGIMIGAYLGGFVLKEFLLGLNSALNLTIIKKAILYSTEGDTFYNMTQRLVLYGLTFYPIILGLIVSKKYKELETVNTESRDMLRIVKISNAFALASFGFMGVRGVTRMANLVYILYILLLTNTAGDNCKSGKLKKETMYIYAEFLGVDIFASIYYIWLSL